MSEAQRILSQINSRPLIAPHLIGAASQSKRRSKSGRSEKDKILRSSMKGKTDGSAKGPKKGS